MGRQGVQVEQLALGIGTWLLGIASVAVLAGGRVAGETRRAGLLQAVGGTPGLTAAVLLAEHLALAVIAAAAGLGIGWLAAPLLSAPADGLIGAPGAPSLTPEMVGAAAAVALGAASVMITVTLVTAVLGMRHRGHSSRVPGGLINPVRAGVNDVVAVLTVALLVLAAVHVTVTTWATVAETRRPLALIRSLGPAPARSAPECRRRSYSPRCPARSSARWTGRA